eukprot:3428358-Prorocentrum_lima.AAC.1
MCIRDRVLVDTGAKEVIRPHNPDWWNEIIVGTAGCTEAGRWSGDKRGNDLVERSCLVPVATRVALAG